VKTADFAEFPPSFHCTINDSPAIGFFRIAARLIAAIFRHL